MLGKDVASDSLCQNVNKYVNWYVVVIFCWFGHT
jgi:hypothetical protein